MMSPMNCASAASMASRLGRASLYGRLAFRVVGVGLDAPANREVVGLLAIYDMGDRLGGLAKGDRQARPLPSGSRVPACPTFLGLKSRFNRPSAWFEVSPCGLSRMSQP